MTRTSDHLSKLASLLQMSSETLKDLAFTDGLQRENHNLLELSVRLEILADDVRDAGLDPMNSGAAPLI